MPWLLVDPVGTLNLAHVGHDGFHLCLGNPFDRGHVAERPVVLAHAVAGGHHERPIAVVAGLIDLVDQRRARAFAPGSVGPMASRTFRLKCARANLGSLAQAIWQVHGNHGVTAGSRGWRIFGTPPHISADCCHCSHCRHSGFLIHALPFRVPLGASQGLQREKVKRDLRAALCLSSLRC